ncbi:type I-E CRISPR-associated protein Cse2/CasB [Streptomyces sp. NPDC002851]
MPDGRELRDRQKAFVRSLYSLASGQARSSNGQDQLGGAARGMLAHLRRSATQGQPNLTVCSMVFEHDPPPSQVDAWLFTASLFGYAPQAAPASQELRSLGAALGHLARGQQGEGAKRRMEHLLAAEPTSLPYYLRQSVRLVHQAGIPLDFLTLLQDMVILLPQAQDGRDSVGRDRLLLRWAQEYHRASQSEKTAEDSEEAGPETDADLYPDNEDL